MSLSEQYNIGARVKAVPSVANKLTTGSSSADNVATTGITIDRNAAGLRRYYSCKSIVAAQLTALTSNVAVEQTLSFQHSSDGTSWDAYSTATNPASVSFGSTVAGTTTVNSTDGETFGTIEQSINLNGARRYVRVVLPVNTFAAANCSSGTFLNLSGVLVFGGADELPAQ